MFDVEALAGPHTPHGEVGGTGGEGDGGDRGEGPYAKRQIFNLLQKLMVGKGGGPPPPMGAGAYVRAWGRGTYAC